MLSSGHDMPIAYTESLQLWLLKQGLHMIKSGIVPPEGWGGSVPG